MPTIPACAHTTAELRPGAAASQRPVLRWRQLRLARHLRRHGRLCGVCGLGHVGGVRRFTRGGGAWCTHPVLWHHVWCVRAWGRCASPPAAPCQQRMITALRPRPCALQARCSTTNCPGPCQRCVNDNCEWRLAGDGVRVHGSPPCCASQGPHASATLQASRTLTPPMLSARSTLLEAPCPARAASSNTSLVLSANAR